MSITSELRDFVDGLACHKVTRDLLREIADRIDQEHESAVIGAMNDALSYANDKDMAELGWVRLPTDAEGVPFRVGDHVEVPDGLPSEGKPWQVGTIARLVLGATCWHVRVIAGGMYHDYLIENVRRYHAPTVEDVLRNVVTLCHNTWKEESPFPSYDVDDVMKSGNIADFAAKLRLAGDE